MDEPFKIVSYYTPEYYEHAHRLIASINRNKIDSYEIARIDSQGSWQRNCAFKAHFLSEMCGRNPDTPIIWLDADATIERRPDLFYELAEKNEVDIAVRMDANPSHPWNRVMSGTIYLGATKNRSHLIRRWAAHCITNPKRWDQVSLAIAIEEGAKQSAPYKVHALPEEYCRVFDRPMSAQLPRIVHWQASRELKDIVGDEGDSE